MSNSWLFSIASDVPRLHPIFKIMIVLYTFNNYHYQSCRCKRRPLTLLAVITCTAILSLYYTSKAHQDDEKVRLTYVQGNADWKAGFKRQDSDTVPSKDTSTMRKIQKAHDNVSHHILTDKRQLGYVIALEFTGQQGANIQSIISLQCLAASFRFPVQILEPIMYDRNFVSVYRREKSHGSYLRFSDLFDVEHFNKVSESIGYVSIGTREDFVASAPNDVIFVKMNRLQPKNQRRDRAPRVLWTATFGKNDCYGGQEVTLELSQLGRDDLCVVRVIELAVDYQSMDHYVLSETDLREVIFGNRLPQDVTTIFSIWRSPWYVENSELHDPSMCKSVGLYSDKKQFLPSPRLVSDSIRYEKDFLNSSREVALMLRMEHMVWFVNHQETSHSGKWTVDSCLQEALRITKGYSKSSLPMVAWDMGKFGSGSWALKQGVIDELDQKSKQLLLTLLDGKLTFEEWEESFTKAARGVEHSGYIAALQRTLASRTKCLVLVGGGSFQDLALKDYLRKHPNKEDQCFHQLCTKIFKYD